MVEFLRCPDLFLELMMMVLAFWTPVVWAVRLRYQEQAARHIDIPYPHYSLLTHEYYNFRGRKLMIHWKKAQAWAWLSVVLAHSTTYSRDIRRDSAATLLRKPCGNSVDKKYLESYRFHRHFGTCRGKLHKAGMWTRRHRWGFFLCCHPHPEEYS